MRKRRSCWREYKLLYADAAETLNTCGAMIQDKKCPSHQCEYRCEGQEMNNE